MWKSNEGIRLGVVVCLLLAACGGENEPSVAPGGSGGTGGSGGSGGGGTGGGIVEPVCGNGIIEVDEVCDDGARNSDTEPDACRTDCTVARCGDGVRDRGEGCDDGNLAPGDGCSESCRPESCGNGVIDEPEECDDGNVVSGDGCSDACTDERVPRCGDGILQAGESCDDGNDDSTDACVACAPAACGDGAVWAGHEDCDDGDTVPGDGCGADCRFEGFCGDGIVNPLTENCDDGNTADDDACRADCTPARCGDGVIWTGEEACDDGEANSNTRKDACRTDCTLPRCGDAVIDTGETCEDGNAVDTDGCIACQTARCGDGFVRAGVEECDAGPANSDTLPDACRSTCKNPRCGDGVTDAGELCDDGNAVPGDGCSPTCETPPVCGNARREAGEACDDGNTAAGDGCSARCNLEANVCGAAIVDLNTLAVPTGAGFTYAGTTAGAGNDSEGSCQPNDGAEVVLSYWLNRRANLHLTTDDGARDTVIYVRTNCAQSTTELDCDDDTGTGESAALVLSDVPAGTQLYLVVDDGPDQASPGPFNLTARITPINGVGGVCDPGGTTALCEPGLYCEGVSKRCKAPTCGDGVREPGEACDDGNTAGGDGCSPTCKVEGENCAAPFVATVGAGGTVSFSGDTRSFLPDYQAGCAPTGANRDVVYAFTSPTQSRWTFTATADFNTVLAAQRTCGQPASNAACSNSDTGNAGGDVMAVDMLAGETVYVLVDGYGSGTVINHGTYAVTGTSIPLIDVGQACDPAGVTSVCVPSARCAAGTCVAHACGDGILYAAAETCDDGNTVSGDGCSAACQVEGNLCAVPGVTMWNAALGQVAFSGDTRAMTANYSAGCAATARNPDMVWSFTPPFRGRYTFAATSSFDVVLAVQPTCGSSTGELACRNAVNGAGGETLTVDLPAGQPIYLLVDGFGETIDNKGTYSVVGTGLPLRAAGESCDPAGVLDLCDPGNRCAAGTCLAHVCGDGIVWTGHESCDDGNAVSGDGCSASCLVEGDVCGAPSFATYDAATRTVTVSGDTRGRAADYQAGCAPTGRNGDMVWRYTSPIRAKYAFAIAADFNTVIAVQSTCGQQASNLACSNGASGSGGDTLTVELAANQTVTLLVDGYGDSTTNEGTFQLVGTAQPIRGTGESCDPAGLLDLCDAAAYCHPTTAQCTLHACGDGRLSATEACDDGNVAAGDGCSPTCAWEVVAESEPNGTAATADAGFRIGRHTGTITPAGDLDFWVLNLTGTDVVFDVWAQTSNGTGGCPFNTVLDLFGPDGTTVLVSDNDDGPTTGCSKIDPAVAADAAAKGLAPGTYYLRVKHNSSTSSSASPYFLDVRATTRAVRPLGQACDPSGTVDVCVASAYCKASTSTCVAHVCGDGVVWAGHEACDDGNGVSGDGCTACALDGDSCASPTNLDSADTSADPNVWVWSGNTATFSRDFDGSVLTGCFNTSGKRDAVAAFTAPQDGIYFAELTTSWDSVLFATSACGGSTGLGCGDTPPSFTMASLVAGQTIFLVVDGYGSTVSESNQGAFTLTVKRRHCGDAIVTAALGEVCDNGAANSNTAPNACRLDCRPARCGDAVTDTGEGCDDGNTVGGDGCSRHCVVEGGCGDFIVQAGEGCDDGNQTAGDGCGTTCQPETGWSCPGNVCAPICGDGLIKGTEQCEDGNAVSWDGCTSCRVDGATCLSAIPLSVVDANPDPAIWTWAGSTATMSRDFAAPCKDSTGKRDAVTAFTAPATATYAFEVTSTWNPVLFAFGSTCGGATVACAGAATGGSESFELALTAGETVHVVIDGDGSTVSDVNSGAFTLTVRKRYCGDGIVSAPEQCDAGPANSNTAPNACRLDCTFARCGDGVVDTGERCDDGNTVDGDGCSATCVISGLCGNGVVNAGETCDDGNAQTGDGCSLACTAEAGWSCTTGTCLPICGDGLVVGPEGCDDGNTVDGDGCDSTCQCGAGGTFTASASIPTAISIPDGLGDESPGAWATATATVTGATGVLVDVDVTVSISHDYSSDLEVVLVAPNGTVVPLARRLFGNADDSYEGTTFDDDANPTLYVTRVSSHASAGNTSGSYPSGVMTPLQPERSLSTLNGLSPNGAWTLKARDSDQIITGTLSAFSVSLKTVASLPPLAPIVAGYATPTPIPDANAASPLVSTINVASTYFQDVAEARVTVNVAHPKAGQLVLTLIAPNNERYVLSNKRGGTASNVFGGTKFHEAATTLANQATYTSGTVQLDLVPESSLGKLVGVPAAGPWKLEVVDDVTGDTGTLTSWAIELVPSSCDLPR